MRTDAQPVLISSYRIRLLLISPVVCEELRLDRNRLISATKASPIYKQCWRKEKAQTVYKNCASGDHYDMKEEDYVIEVEVVSHSVSIKNRV